MNNQFSRRSFLKSGAVAIGAIAAAGFLSKVDPVFAAAQGGGTGQAVGNKARVYFTKDPSAEGLRKMYDQVGQHLTGKVAVKLHTGEPGGPNIIPREWVKALLPRVPNPTIVECNVTYDSPRKTAERHLKVVEANVWTFAPMDIMDAGCDVNLPVKGGKWLKEVALGRNIVKDGPALVVRSI